MTHTNSEFGNVWTFGSLRRDIVRKVRQLGFAGAARHAGGKLAREVTRLVRHTHPETDAFDQKYGTDTAAIVSVGSLDIPAHKLEHTNRYEAVVPEVFNASLRGLPIDHSDYVFIDIGCGKGRAILLATRFPFRRIIGIDLSERLIDVACKNVSVFRDELQACFEVEAVCSDATAFQLPRQNAVLYFNNPFDAEIMQLVLNNIEASLRATPRKLIAIYQRPLHRQVWDRSPYFRLAATTDRFLVYESKDELP